MSHVISVNIAAIDSATQIINQVRNSLATMAGGAAQASGGLNSLASASNHASSGLNNTAAAARNAGGGLSDVLKQAAGFALATAGVQGMHAAVKGLADALIGYNAKMEQTRIGLETMIGDAGAAALFIQQMKDFASKTPFEFKDVDKASKKLLAFGWAVKDIIPDLTAIGNAASGLGIGKEGIDRITLAIGQMAIKTKLSGEEVRQLNEAGIGAQQYLMKAFNLTADAFDDLGKTGVTGLQAARAILEGMANDPKFAGMMEKQSKTMIGYWSTIKDVAAEVFGFIGEGSFTALNKLVGNVADGMSRASTAFREGGMAKMLTEIFPDDWAERFWKLGDLFVKMADTGGNAGTVLKNAFEPVLGVVTDLSIAITDKLLGSISGLTEFATENMDGVKAILYGVAAGFTAIKFSALAARIAAGEFAITLGILSGPAGWAAIAVGATTAAIAYFASKNEVDNSTNAADMYAGNFDQVGNAAETAAGKIDKMTAAQARWYQEQSKVGGMYEDMSSRKLAEKQDIASDYLKKHKGTLTPPPPGIDKNGLRTESKMQEALNKVQEMFAKLNEKIISETGTTYQSGQQKIADELTKMTGDINKMKTDLAKDGLSVDTSVLMMKMEEYKTTMMAALKRTWEQARALIKNQTDLASAQLIGDKSAQADAEYNIAVAALNKEKIEREKATKETKDDVAAQKAVDEWYAKQLALLLQKRTDAQRQAKLDEYDREIATNTAKFEANLLTQSQLDELNRQVLENKLKYLEIELKAEGLTKEKILELRQNLATGIKTISTIKSNTVDAYDREVESNNAKLAARLITQEQANTANRKALELQLYELQRQLADKVAEESKKANPDMNSADIVALRKKLGTITQGIEALPQTTAESINSGLRVSFDSFGTYLNNIVEATKTAATAMRDAFSDFFFDAMTGKLKSLGDYITSFLQGVARAISQLMANQFARNILGNLFGGGSLIGYGTAAAGVQGPSMSNGGFYSSPLKIPGNAVGGRRSYGETFVVGENGPEIVSLDGAGAQISDAKTTAGRLGGGSSSEITVNVINNSGNNVKATASEPKFDGQRFVIDVVLDAIARDVSGMRTLLQGVR